MTEHSLYLDDSGHPKDQPYVVVAGFVAVDLSHCRSIAYDNPAALCGVIGGNERSRSSGWAMNRILQRGLAKCKDHQTKQQILCHALVPSLCALDRLTFASC
jgi:hypothetical protein